MLQGAQKGRPCLGGGQFDQQGESLDAFAQIVAVGLLEQETVEQVQREDGLAGFTTFREALMLLMQNPGQGEALPARYDSAVFVTHLLGQPQGAEGRGGGEGGIEDDAGVDLGCTFPHLDLVFPGLVGFPGNYVV